MTLPLTAPDSMLALLSLSITLRTIEKLLGRPLTPDERAEVLETLP